MLCDVPLTSPVRGAKRPLPEAASSLRPTKQPRTASAGLQPILTAPSLWSIFLGARSVRAAPVRAGLPAPIASTAAGASIAQLQGMASKDWQNRHMDSLEDLLQHSEAVATSGDAKPGICARYRYQATAHWVYGRRQKTDRRGLCEWMVGNASTKFQVN
ncbi:hypothetical protein BDZ88DRAFT_36174 [Geranomyces variabilis]|nr:hypothetical protein BDZ88DRAFT_36174 [Geranomyces variabilis]